MAKYRTTFSEYTTDAAPSDWSGRWNTSEVSWEVKEVSGVLGGKLLRAIKSNTAARSILSWDVIDADSGRANIEIVARFRSTLNTQATGPAVIHRAANDVGSGNAMTARLNGSTSSSSRFKRIHKVVDGALPEFIASADLNWSADTWYWVRFRSNGSTHSASFWTGDYGDDPGTWDISETDSDISAAGWAGVYIFSVMTVDWDYFSVGTGGDSAPGPDDELEPEPTEEPTPTPTEEPTPTPTEEPTPTPTPSPTPAPEGDLTVPSNITPAGFKQWADEVTARLNALGTVPAGASVVLATDDQQVADDNPDRTFIVIE